MHATDWLVEDSETADEWVIEIMDGADVKRTFSGVATPIKTYLFTWTALLALLLLTWGLAMLDLSPREILVFAPLVALVVWMGIYPTSFLRPIQPSLSNLVERVENAQAAQLERGRLAARVVER